MRSKKKLSKLSFFFVAIIILIPICGQQYNYKATPPQLLLGNKIEVKIHNNTNTQSISKKNSEVNPKIFSNKKDSSIKVTKCNYDKNRLNNEIENNPNKSIIISESKEDNQTIVSRSLVPNAGNLTIWDLRLDLNPMSMNEYNAIRCTVAEIGGGSVYNRTISYYLSTNTTITSSDYHLGNDYISLAAGANSPQSISFKPENISGLSPGTYYIGIIIPDEDESFCYATQLVINSLSSDLEVYSFAIDSGENPLYMNQTGTITAYVREIGGNSVSNRKIEYYLSTDDIISTSDYYLGNDYVTLSANASSTWSITYKPEDINGLLPGDYYIGIIIPYENDKYRTTTAMYKILPALESNLEIPTTTFSVNPCAMNESITIMNTIREVAGVSVSSRRIKYYLSTNTTITSTDIYLGDDYVTLSANSSGNETITFKPEDISGLNTGSYYFGIVIPDENDTWSCPTPLVISPSIIADIELTNLIFSSNPAYLNDDLTITSGIKEVGGASINNHEIKYYLSLDENISNTDYYIGSNYINIEANAEISDPITFVPGNILGLEPNEYYVGVIIPDENNEVWGTSSAILSIITTPTSNTYEYYPPFTGATKIHLQEEISADWGRRVSSIPSENDPESGIIHHASLAAAKIVGSTIWVVEDKITVPINIPNPGYYKMTINGKTNGAIWSGRIGDLSSCTHVLKIHALAERFGGQSYELTNTIGEDNPDVIKWLMEQSASVLISLLFPANWGSYLYDGVLLATNIAQVIDQLQEIHIFDDLTLGDNGIVLYGIIEQAGNYNISIEVYSMTSAAVFGGLIVSLINTNTQIDEIIVEEQETISICEPQTPVLLTPQNEKHGVLINPLLCWDVSNDATSYRLQLSSNSSFSSTLYDINNIESTSYKITGLNYSSKYYWRVSASNQTGNSSFSNIWSFTTIPSIPEKPILISPSNSSNEISISPIFQWNELQNAKSYRLQISKSSNFSSIEEDISNITDNSYHIQNLVSNTTYYWRVCATNEGGTGLFSNIWSFNTINQVYNKPDTPLLQYPINEAHNILTSPTLSWNVLSNAVSYHIQVSLDQAFNLITYENNSVYSNSIYLNNLSENTLYYWRICASNNYGTSDWSLIWNFETGNQTFIINSDIIPKNICLYQNYPNPFNPITTIPFSLPEKSYIILIIYDLNLKEVYSIKNEMERGYHELTLNLDSFSLSSGVYIYSLKANNFYETKKMVFMK